jgi:hypothetical protein
MRKKLILGALSLAAVVGLSACNNLDVIGDTSVKSFNAVLDTAKDQVSEDTSFGGWSIQSPDGEARFVFSKDFSKTNPDAFLEADVKPFLDAGLDPAKLPAGMFSGDKIIVGTDLGSDNPTYVGDITPIKSYEQIVALSRYSLKYHTALDHFGIDLGNGNTFEWAKKMDKNDKDIVYVLDPGVFLNAGVNPQKVKGWTYATIQTMDQSGKKIQADKFLKPFNLDGNQ